jgi:hypothetical protein
MHTNQIAQIEPADEYPVYSTVTVENVDSSDVAGDLNPFPDVTSELFPAGVDPNGLVGSGTGVFILTMQALNPPIGGGVGTGSSGPGDPDFFDSVIGMTIRSSGQYSNVEVPIYPIDGVETAASRVPTGGTFPPNPDGETSVIAQLWTPVPLAEGVKITPFPTGVEILTIDGTPIRDDATITALDQNDAVEPFGSAQDGISIASTSSGW